MKAAMVPPATLARAATTLGAAAALALTLGLLRQQRARKEQAQRAARDLPKLIDKRSRLVKRKSVRWQDLEDAQKQHTERMQSLCFVRHIQDVAAACGDHPEVADVGATGDLGKFFSFRAEYQTHFRPRVDADDAALLRVVRSRCITPKGSRPRCVLLELDLADTGLRHLCNGARGKALSVYAANDAGRVRGFLSNMNLDPLAVVRVDHLAPSRDVTVMTALTTLEKLFCQYLDIFGRPDREFLAKLYPYAADIQEKVAIAELTLERKSKELEDLQAQGTTFADLFVSFPSLHIPADKYSELVPTIKPRVYSICSSSDYRPDRCQLLVEQSYWQASGGETKHGLCSSFLASLCPGTWCVGHSTDSAMQMPRDPATPVYMACAGAGIAPFRAFMEQRMHERSEGTRVGPLTLFRGGRPDESMYFQDEVKAYEEEGIVGCRCALPRDGPDEVHVQNEIWQDLGVHGSRGVFYVCGPRALEEQIHAALTSVFQRAGGLTSAEAHVRVEALQAQRRFVLDVY